MTASPAPRLRVRACLLGAAACIAILGAGCSSDTATSGRLAEYVVEPSTPIDTGMSISASGTPTTPLAKQLRTVTKADKPGVPVRCVRVGLVQVWTR